MNLYIATHALSDSNQQFFNFMLKLIKKQLKTNWILGQQDNANVIVVDVDQPQGRQFWHSHQGSQRLIAFSWSNALKTRWYLPKPLRDIQPLVEVLNQFTNLYVPITSAESTPQFEPQYYLLGLIQEALKAEKPQCFRYGAMALYLLPEPQQCFMLPTDLKQLKLFCGMQAIDIEQTRLSEVELLSQIQQDNLHLYRLETILWLSTLYASHGRLMIGYEKTQQLRLKSWPNFTKLPYKGIHMDLAAFMVRQSSDVVTIAQEKQVSLSTVIDFLNACIVLDLVECTQQTDKPPQRGMIQNKRQFFKSLLKQLFKAKIAA